MIFDSLGLPKENGATDLQDSARLAGILTVFDWPKSIPLQEYLENGRYLRHPEEYIYDFSRDQAVCLIAGYGKLEMYNFVDASFITGHDILSPSVRGHIQRCKGLKATWFQNAWLWLDVTYSALVKPMNEPNQLLCMMMLANTAYLLFWLKHNKYWRESIRNYWSSWRGEGDLAEHIISRLEKIEGM